MAEALMYLSLTFMGFGVIGLILAGIEKLTPKRQLWHTPLWKR